MRKQTMKILSALLCVLMTMSSFTVFAAENTQTAGNDNAVTIYYKGYSNPYIHYQVGNGNWTAVPGKAMTPDTTVDGYTHTYTIDLGSYSYANVCFNDGHGNWDSRNGQNYRFNKGTYTFKNGVITPITVDNKFGIESLNISPADGKITVGDYVDISVKLKNADSSAVNKYTYVDSTGYEIVIHDYAQASGCAWQFNKAGTYKVRVYSKTGYMAKDYVMAEKTVVVSNKKLAIKSIDLTPADGKVTVGQSFNINVTLDNATTSAVKKYTYVDAKGNESTIHDYSQASGCAWQFPLEGTYKIRVYAKESYTAKDYVVAEKTVTVIDNNKTENLTTIYYKGYSTPYIHYQVENGSWTNAPGYKMTATSEKAGYTHKYVINLGTKSYVNVCFNDGHGDWDSQNGRNYHFEKGTYTFKNGVITPVTGDNKFGIESLDTSLSNGKVTVGQSFEISVKLKNATTQAVNKFTYVDPYGNESTIHNYANAYGCAWQFPNTGVYKIRVYSKESYTATDYVMAEKSIIVENKKFGIKSVDLTPTDGKVTVGQSFNIDVTLDNATTQAVNKFTSVDANGNETTIHDYANAYGCAWQYYKAGTYKIRVYSKESYTATNYVMAEKTVTVVDNKFGIEALNISPADGKITEGDYIDISVKLKNADSSAVNKYTYVDPNGNEHVIHDYAQASGCAWQFNKAGTYKVRVYSKTGYMATDYVMAEKTVTVEKKSANVVTIYYKGYSTPYIHYQVGNGNWTAVPGKAMTATNEKSGYTHKYTIDLGTSTYANVCFNNGNGSWDSRNGQNYHFEKGTYTFSNGNMTKIAD